MRSCLVASPLNEPEAGRVAHKLGMTDFTFTPLVQARFSVRIMIYLMY